MSAIYVISLLMVLSSNLYLFIFFYELIILPIFFILSGYGNYYRSVQASFFILIWALVGSIFLFIGLFIYARQGSNSFLVVSPGTSQDLNLASIALFLGFLVNVPLWPSHYWISRAHAEGPTNLSIFLSGVLVKLSILGLMSVSEGLGLKLSTPLLASLAGVGVIDTTLNMLVQVDANVVVAFSTTVQMNFILFCLFTLSPGASGVLNAGLINHMLTASVLFFLVDTILVSFNTREFFFLSGLYASVPLLSAAFLFGLINQINFPGFLGFTLDIFYLTTVLPAKPFSAFLVFFFLFSIEHLYVLFFFLKINFGVTSNIVATPVNDLNWTELSLFVYLLGISVVLGCFPLTL